MTRVPWIVGGLLAVVVVAAAVAVEHYHSNEEQGHKTLVALSRLESLAFQERAWQAVAERQAPDRLSAAQSARRAIAATLGDASQRKGLEPLAPAVIPRLDRYQGALDREVALYDSLRISDALAVEAAEVTPAFDELTAEIAAASARVESNERAARAAATVGIIAVVTFTFLTLASFIAWREHQQRELRRAFAAWRRAEEQLRMVVSNAPVVLWAVDSHGRFSLAEGTGLQAMRLAPVSPIGRLASDVYADAPGMIANLSRGLAGEEFSDVVTIDGRLFETWYAPLRCAAGTVVGLTGVAYDVTARVESERERARLASIIESTDDAVVGRAVDGTIATWNPGAERMFGWTAAEMVGTQFTRHLPDRTVAQIVKVRDADGGRERIRNLESAAFRRDGGRLTVLLSSFNIFTPDGAPVGSVSMVRDITEGKAAEHARRSAEEQLHRVTRNAPIIVWAVDSEGVFTLAEGKALAMHGMEASELLGVSFRSFFAGRYPEIIEHMERGLAGEEFDAVEQYGDAWLDTHYLPLRGDSGEMAGLAGVCVDVTSKLEAERALLQAQKLESLGLLAGGIAHDFNNLLVGILGNAGVARALLGHSTAEESLAEIEVAARRAAELAGQMLAYSGRGTFVVESVDLNALVREMTDLLHVATNKAHLDWDVAATLPPVEVDATQVRQVVMNLVANAGDAVGDGGTIRITTGTMHATREYLTEPYIEPGLPEGEYVFLEVADDGPGMDAATIGRVFDPFFTTKFTGRGLGLAAVLGIVRGHRGAMKVASAPGQGTSFRLLLPCAAQATAAPVAVPQGAPDAVRREQALTGTVLVVDDEEIVRSVTARALRHYGLDVLEAADGLAGVEAFRQHAGEISCVLLDMTMPGLDGESAFRQMRAIRADARVILVSGYSAQDALGRFGDAGLAGFIQKPFELATLRSELSRVLAA